jgi:hypothetical protein
MDGEDDFLGSMGLGKLLASEGVDSSGLNTLLARGRDASASNDFANIDNNSDDGAGYEDDLDDHDLLPETDAEKAARAKEKQEEARYRRMALQMNKELEAKRTSASKVKGKYKDDPKDVVKRIWPDFEPGRRLRMTDVLYETPYAREQYKEASYRRKRRKVVHESKRKSCIKTGLPTECADAQTHLPLRYPSRKTTRISWRIFPRFECPSQVKHRMKHLWAACSIENGSRELEICRERQ